jgi:coproporphyrinogen III oxidase-like Fe-S oxidoreductase
VNIYTLISKVFRRVNRRYLCFPEATAGARLPSPSRGRRYLLYLHIPYCVVLCPFCSFHRVKFNRERAQQYFRALHHEIELVTDEGYKFDELYVGGGTPTVLPDELIKTIDLVRKSHSIKGISVETSPDHLGDDRLLQLQKAGVNRLSVGVQSFDDTLLHEMGRFEKYGSGSQVRQQLRRATGILDTLNVDMIFNFPHQTAASLRRDLDILVDELVVDQVSFYPLMSVNSTRKMMLNTVGRVDHSRERKLYKMIAKRMLAAGYTRSSAWCFSQRPGMSDEYIAGREEYLGLGSGSFSYLQGSLYASTFSINHYLRMLQAGKTGTDYRRDMSERDQMRYFLLTELFAGSLEKVTTETRFEGRFQRTMWPELAALRAIGAIRDSAGVLTLTESGYYLWVLLMREFLTGINGLRDQMRHNIAHAIPIQPPTAARF